MKNKFLILATLVCVITATKAAPDQTRCATVLKTKIDPRFSEEPNCFEEKAATVDEVNISDFQFNIFLLNQH